MSHSISVRLLLRMHEMSIVKTVPNLFLENLKRCIVYEKVYPTRMEAAASATSPFPALQLLLLQV